MTKISNLLLSATAGAVATLSLQAVPANAANLTFSSATVDASSNTGLSLSGGGNFQGTDFFSLTVSGTVDTAPTQYITNAAGILTQPYSGSIPLATGDSYAGPNNATLGALLIGNSTLGYFQLFPSNATNGAGSTTPPTNFSFNDILLSSIFGTALDTTSTSDLNLIVNDSLYADNSGAFTVTGSISSTAVPEPFTIIGTLIGGTAAVRMRKKLQAVSK